MLDTPGGENYGSGDRGIERLNFRGHWDTDEEITMFPGFVAESLPFASDDKHRRDVELFFRKLSVPFSCKPVVPESSLFEIVDCLIFVVDADDWDREYSAC